MTRTKKFGDRVYTFFGHYATYDAAFQKAREFRDDGLSARVQGDVGGGYAVWYYGGPIYKTFGGKKYSKYGGFASKAEAEKKVASLRRTLHSKDVVVVPAANVWWVYCEKSLVTALDRSIKRRIKR